MKQQPSPDKVALSDALTRFSETWSPRIVGDINDSQVKVVKCEGEFVWHHHDAEDEMFLVLDGTMTMRFRDREVDMEAGDVIIVPSGVEHQPVATPTCSVLLVEPNTTLNTGNAESELTVENLDRLA